MAAGSPVSVPALSLPKALTALAAAARSRFDKLTMRVPASRPERFPGTPNSRSCKSRPRFPFIKERGSREWSSDRAPKRFRNLAETRCGRPVLRAGRVPCGPCTGRGPRHHHAWPFRPCAARPWRRAGDARDHRRHEGAARRGMRRLVPGGALRRDLEHGRRVACGWCRRGIFSAARRW